MRFPSAAVVALLLAAPCRAADCSMGSNTDCVSTSNPERKSQCITALYAIREACNGKADNAQAKMQELGSTTNKAAKPEMASYLVALNTLYEISRAAQQLSNTDPKALELLKDVNMDTGEQEYRMNRTFEIVAKMEKEATSKIKEAVKKEGEKTDKPKTSRRTPEGTVGESGGSGGSSGDSAAASPKTEKGLRLSAVPRRRFMKRKNDYRERPKLQDESFRHIGLTESERDFQRSASSSTLHRAVHEEPESGFDVPAKEMQAASAGTAEAPTARSQGSSPEVPGLEAARALGTRLPSGRYLAGGVMLAAALALLRRRRAT